MRCVCVSVSHLHDSRRIRRLRRGWRLLLDVAAAPDLRLHAADPLQRLLSALLPLLHPGEGLQDGLHLPLFSSLRRDRCRGGGGVIRAETLVHGERRSHRAPEVCDTTG